MDQATAKLLAPALLVILALAGCGNKGPLQMPPSTKQPATGKAEAPRADAGASVGDTNTPAGPTR